MRGDCQATAARHARIAEHASLCLLELGCSALLTLVHAEQVNEITPPLFTVAPDAQAMAGMKVRNPALA